METDKHFYEIFEVNPQWIFELTGRPSPGPCQFVSLTLKAIERRSDGVLVPDSPSESISITELQMQPDKEIYGRLVIEMALMQSERPGRSVDGIIIFGTRELDPHTEPWRKVVSVYYLDEQLDQLMLRNPNHPLIAVFQPVVEKNRELLERNAAMYYTQIKSSASDEREKGKLLSVFVDWMMQRFSELGKQEIEKMLFGQLPDLRDTQSGKDLIAIGIEKGSLIGTIRTCQSVLGLAVSSEKNLMTNSMEELTEMARKLQASVKTRF
jgi:predicted transposase YdaD